MILATDNTARLCGRCHREQHDQLRTPPAQLRDEFFETDQFRAAFESQHIGKVFKAYRNHPRHLQLFGKALNQELLGRWLGLTQAQVSKLENGKPEQNLETLRAYAKILHLPQHLLWFDMPGQSRLGPPISRRRLLAYGATVASVPLLSNLNHVRAQTDMLMDTQSINAQTMDDWEQAVDGYGVLELTASPEQFLGRVAADFTEVQNTLRRRQPIKFQKRLYRITGQMAGLIAIVSHDVGFDSESWFRTARRAGDEIEDQELEAWAMSHQSMTYLWGGQPIERGVRLAQEAQSLGGSSGAGAIAAVMEARTQARLGRRAETIAAVRRSDQIFERLDPSSTRMNVLGAYEHLLRFCQSYSLTAIGETAAALEVQQRVLALPAGNVVDASLIQMDRASCLIQDGQPDEGCRLAGKTLIDFPLKSRVGLLVERARELLKLAPADSHHAAELKIALRSLREDSSTSRN